jgi:hypothetical protein
MECEMAELLTDMIHLKDRLANIVLDLIQSFASTYSPVHDVVRRFGMMSCDCTQVPCAY